MAAALGVLPKAGQAGALQIGHTGIKIIQSNEAALLFSPLPHAVIATVTPRQDFDLPSLLVHPLQIGMESAAIGKTNSIPTEEHGNARVAIVVDGITEHGGLQRLVHTLLLPPQLAPQSVEPRSPQPEACSRRHATLAGLTTPPPEPVRWAFAGEPAQSWRRNGCGPGYGHPSLPALRLRPEH